MDIEKMIQLVLDHPANHLNDTSKDMLTTIQNFIKIHQTLDVNTLPTDKDIHDKAKKHMEEFPENTPYRSYKTGYHHALMDLTTNKNHD